MHAQGHRAVVDELGSAVDRPDGPGHQGGVAGPGRGDPLGGVGAGEHRGLSPVMQVREQRGDLGIETLDTGPVVVRGRHGRRPYGRNHSTVC